MTTIIDGIDRANSLGRIAAHNLGNDQDAAYPMSMAFTVDVPLPNWRYWSHFFGPLDQLATGTCVLHAVKHWMQAAPVVQTSPRRPPFPYDMYRQVVLLDEWFDNDHEATQPDSQLFFGTSVRAAFKWLQGRGYVGNYLWAQNPDQLQRFVLTQGPVVIGIPWHEGMFLPDEHGFIQPDGAVAGGHSVLVIGHNKVRGDYTILNSWGPNWGSNGRARIKSADLHKLIFDSWGEAAAGIETRLG